MQRIHKGYSSCPFCLSVTTLNATYLVFKSHMKCHKVLYGVFNKCIMWISQKTLHFEVMGRAAIYCPFSTYSTNSNRTLSRQKVCLFSGRSHNTRLPKIERFSWTTLASMLGGFFVDSWIVMACDSPCWPTARCRLRNCAARVVQRYSYTSSSVVSDSGARTALLHVHIIIVIATSITHAPIPSFKATSFISVIT